MTFEHLAEAERNRIVTPMRPDEFERLAVKQLSFRLLTWWEQMQYTALREKTHSTASLPGLAFESIRMEGHHPETALVIYFREVTRPEFLFGWIFRFWAYHDQTEKMAQADAEKYGDHIFMEFFEGLDITEPSLPPSEDCSPTGVTWIPADLKIDLADRSEAPWLGP